MEATPGEYGLEYENVRLESEDGVPLAAWWVETPGAERAAVLVHGWGSNKSAGYALETAAVYADAGYSVLMLDLRGHGESTPVRRTLGYREVRDVRGALSWLGERGVEPGKVVLHGWSMGGATVVRAAPGTGVAAVIEDSGYADLPLELRDQLPANSGLPRAFNPGTMLAAKLFLGFDPWAVRPYEQAARLRAEKVPLLIIHSSSDEVVPFEHARRFREAYPEADLWKLEGYDHVQSYRSPSYAERLLGFLEESSPVREAALSGISGGREGIPSPAR